MNPTDLEITYGEGYRVLARQSNEALAKLLQWQGVIYPSVDELVGLSKEELISMLLEAS